MKQTTEALYQKREKIQPRYVDGYYQQLRRYTRWLTVGIYFILPWLRWAGHPLILFDVHNRKFYIFSYTFWPQDLFLLVLLILIAALTLFFFTTLAGRLWCGYTCPQTVWINIFIWIEYQLEGDRNKRIKLDKSPWGAEKIIKRGSKHTLWLLFAFITALTLGGYFQPIYLLIDKILHWQQSGWDTFWIVFFTLATYVNAGWMREQICLYMCPYARFQSVMYDQKTLIIAYDVDRGEPRGARKKNIDPKSKGLGHCIQCQKCVQVCPTGIDIRDGLQMACIGCAACIDVCDDVMQKMHYPKGLIRYQTGESGKNMQSLLRPRLVTYGVLLISLVLLLSYLLIERTPLRLDVIRDRNQLYSVTTEEQIKNTYLLKVMNLTQQRKHYQISVSSPIQSTFVGAKKITLLPGEIANLPVSLLIDEDLLKQPKTNIAFKVCEISNEKQCVITESRFIYL